LDPGAHFSPHPSWKFYGGDVDGILQGTRISSNPLNVALNASISGMEHVYGQYCHSSIQRTFTRLLQRLAR
jgi:hypothetical protein